MIDVHADPTTDHISRIKEMCCFCRTPTLMWHQKDDGETVACCEKCAKFAKKEDVPRKEDWCRREDIVTHAQGQLPYSHRSFDCDLCKGKSRT